MKRVSLRKAALVSGCVLAGALLVPGSQAVAASISQVFITNDPAHPVPVAINGTPNVNVTNFPPAAAPPLWQGTPYVRRVIGGDDTGSNEVCLPFEPIPAGMVLFAQRVVGNVGVSAGGSAIFVRLTPLGGASSQYVSIPAHDGGPNSALVEGGVELGIPVSEISGCFFRGQGALAVIGYLIPAP